MSETRLSAMRFRNLRRNENAVIIFLGSRISNIALITFDEHTVFTDRLPRGMVI